MDFVFLFVFFYPLFMAIFWMMGALTFFTRRERDTQQHPELPSHPRVAILVPCHNEEICIRDAIERLSDNNYPNFEIVAINDGSTDRTGEILQELSKTIDCLRVVTLTDNFGKAMALRAGAVSTSAEFLMCIDADALLDKNALFWMVKHFIEGPRVGAVTGNPRVFNRGSLLARIQIGEFSAIIGMVKRTQRSIGRIFTVSGVNACFRSTALHQVGYWSPETVTEDIDISWKLQLNRWDIRYEPRAITWILVPETIRTLWRQRLRWARGGFEASIKFAKDIKTITNRRMWSVYTEYWVGVAWCYAFAFTVLCWAGTNYLPPGMWPESMAVPTLIPGWTGVVLAVTCLAQFTVALVIDSQYEQRGLLRYLFWAIWYPALYWIINAVTTIVAVPVGIYKRGKTHHAVWKSPNRRLEDWFMRIQRRKDNEHRHYFRENIAIKYSRKMAELLVTIVFWGLWVYLITPLLSLLLWMGGIYLFVDRMIAMGGYQTFASHLVDYSIAIFVMWLLLTLWVLWNLLRYGKRNRRSTGPRLVTSEDIAAAIGCEPATVDQLKASREIFLHFDENDHPVVEKVKV